MQTFKPVWGDFIVNKDFMVENGQRIANPLDAAVARRLQEAVWKLPQQVSTKQ